MMKSLISALGLAAALAIAVPSLEASAATTTAAPATSGANTQTTSTQATSAAKPMKKMASAGKKVCHSTKTHKCPVHHHARKAMKKTA
jgi:hypothetical protein